MGCDLERGSTYNSAKGYCTSQAPNMLGLLLAKMIGKMDVADNNSSYITVGNVNATSSAETAADDSAR